ncbi:hypothetical protein M3Y99_01410400 [Aphelenchoides fujianensis]|nr:hypothetical protein M3Y99_01410400 [Aphelenchoides fujianensis]
MPPSTSKFVFCGKLPIHDAAIVVAIINLLYHPLSIPVQFLHMLCSYDFKHQWYAEVFPNVTQPPPPEGNEDFLGLLPSVGLIFVHAFVVYLLVYSNWKGRKTCYWPYLLYVGGDLIYSVVFVVAAAIVWVNNPRVYPFTPPLNYVMCFFVVLFLLAYYKFLWWLFFRIPKQSYDLGPENRTDRCVRSSFLPALEKKKNAHEQAV